MSLAILYINSHHNDGKYVLEANLSAASFRQYLPDARYYLYTDFAGDSSYVSNFDKVIACEFNVPEGFEHKVHLNGQMFAKHQAMLEMSEDHVMYLGADTYALKEDVADMVKILDQFEIALTHAPVRINTELGNSSIPSVPRCFPELNCDLILYRNNDKVRPFIEEWQNAYTDNKFDHPHDQGTFREIMYRSGLRLAILPPEYNYRGHEYRSDTVILQNRFTLQDYISPQQNPTRQIFSKVIGKFKK